MQRTKYRTYSGTIIYSTTVSLTPYFLSICELHGSEQLTSSLLTISHPHSSPLTLSHSLHPLCGCTHFPPSLLTPSQFPTHPLSQSAPPVWLCTVHTSHLTPSLFPTYTLSLSAPPVWLYTVHTLTLHTLTLLHLHSLTVCTPLYGCTQFTPHTSHPHTFTLPHLPSLTVCNLYG